MGVEAPLALLGLFGIAAPILVHLLRRRDLPVVRLPTVAMLARAQAASRRRSALFDRILLALRIAIVAAAVLGIARPFLWVPAALGDGRARAVAIVVDDSMSTGRRAQGSTCLDAIGAQARRIVDSMARGSEISVVAAGAPARVLVPRTSDLAAARTTLSRLGPTGRGTDLAVALQLASRTLDGAGLDAQIVVLSDFATHAHGREAIEAIARAGRAVDAMRPSSCDRLDDIAIASAEAAQDPTRNGAQAISVELAAQRSDGRTVNLSVHGDGHELAAGHVALDERGGRTSITVRDAPASGVMQVEVDADDALAEDDRRGVLVAGVARRRLVVVDGDPNVSRADAESRYLRPALESTAPLHGFDTEIVDPGEMEHRALDGYDIVVFANTVAPSLGFAQRLRTFVERGGGLIVAPGNHADARAWSTALTDLLPARPRASELHGAWTFSIATGSDELASANARWLLETPPRDAHVALRFADGEPALVLGTHGRGKTALFATTFDDDWTDLPYHPAFLELVTELLHEVGAPSGPSSRPYACGTTVSLPVPHDASGLAVVDPLGHTVRLIPRSPETLVTYIPDHVGAYVVHTLERPERPLAQLAFTATAPSEETTLTVDPVPSADASGLHGGGARAARTKREVSSWIFALAALLVAIEGWVRVRGRATTSDLATRGAVELR